MKSQSATKIAEKDINSSEYSISFSPALLMAGNEALLKKIEEQQREIEILKQREYAVKVADPNPYSDYKSDGVRKAHAADSIRSYDDFKAIQDYFLKKNDVRDWALWTIGVSLGLRISDLFLLRFNNIVCEYSVE